MGACRYEQGPCTFPTLRRHFKCQDGSCPDQVGRLCSRPDPETKPAIRETPEPIRETKPAAPPPAREKEETMPDPTPAKIGTCPKCKRPDVKLVANKFDVEHPKTCPRCYNTAWAADKASRTEAANAKRSDTIAAKKKALASPGPAKAKKAHAAPPVAAAPKPPAAKPITSPRPAQPSGAGLTLTFQITLEQGLTAGSMAEIVGALPAGAVVVW